MWEKKKVKKEIKKIKVETGVNMYCFILILNGVGEIKKFHCNHYLII